MDSLEAESLERTGVGKSTALTGAICKGRGLVKVKMEEENRSWVLLRAWRFAEKKKSQTPRMNPCGGRADR